MKILEDNTTPNSRRVRLFLIEKEIDLPFEQMNATEAECNAPDSAEIKSFQRIPALVLESGAKLSEISAIWRYFEELEPEPSLMGEDPFGKANIEMWNKRLENCLFDFIFQKPANDLPGWGEINRPKAEEAFLLLNAELAQKEFVAGKMFSIADISAFVAIGILSEMNIIPSPELQNLTKWYQAVQDRPGFRTTSQQAESISA